MKSYASVDRIEGQFAICEVELVNLEESKSIKYFEKETEMIDIPLEQITGMVGKIHEGDILIVEHDGKALTAIYCKDDDEKNRRIQEIIAIMKG